MTVTHGVTLAADDVAVVLINVNNQPTISDNNGASPFTQQREDNCNGTSGRCAIWFRRLSGSEGTTFDFTLGSLQRWAIIGAVYRGVAASGTIWDVVPNANLFAATTTPVATDITTLTDGAYAWADCSVDSATVTFSAWPSGFSSIADELDQSCNVSDKSISPTGTVSAGWTISASTPGTSHLGALLPAAGGAAGHPTMRRWDHVQYMTLNRGIWS